ncbi:MerR family transcriptional regulator [uncultured Clostridium sp.]|uniref:MerR family transcriptional regulator n=1 Tax=uncultured Clostridium sp. TaxID=59620 RepID=UPI0025E80627|nr:MerR family transcriptional regulator [uncultured Clostridium sp.]
MKINDVAKLTGITVRTLHYYDEIGLLKPSKITDAGYRIYDEKNLETLQQILLFREMNFPLSEIKEIISNPKFDRIDALEKHKNLLIKKRQRLDNLINLVNNTIKGENDMSFKEFDMTEIEATKKKYAKGVKERYGKTDAYKEYEVKTKNYDKDKWNDVNTEANEIFKTFADNKDKAPESEEVQELVKRWQSHITKNYYNCTKEILASLGLMYVNDERFKKNIDKCGEGTAEFMSKAIEVYCSK